MKPIATQPVVKRVTGVRWTILALLATFSFVSYLNRMNISIAAQLMGMDLGLDSVQLGRVFSSFLLGYALFQVPAGILGDRFGPRLVLTWAAVSWCVFSALTAVLPGTILGHELGLLPLIIVRFLLGVGEAPTYPVAARALGNWFPRAEIGLANSIVIGGIALGSACTPPVISWLMIHIGWRNSFYLGSVAALLIAIVWALYGTDQPGQHHRVSPEENRLISEGKSEVRDRSFRMTTCWKLLANREISLLTVSYLCLGYVFYIFIFWFYTYLVKIRGFSTLESGFVTSMPFVVAAVMTPFGGWLTDLLSLRMGRRWGRRSVSLVGMSLASFLLFVGAFSSSPYVAVSSLCLCVGSLELTEGAFWASAIDVAGSNTGTASGIMNMGCNLGGVVSTAAMPVLVNHMGWLGALSSGAVVGLIGSCLWFGIRADQPFQAAEKLLRDGQDRRP